jgi:putative transposase
MTREARIVLPGVPQHITQRGVRRATVFVDDADFQNYLSLFKENADRFGLRICAYCLMGNHVHFVAIPNARDSIWKTFHRCHSIYAMNFNEKYQLSGHLWEGRPFSCLLDEAHLWAAVRYVELNPVRAGIVRRACDYPWSSARGHCGLWNDPLIDPAWQPANFAFDWIEWLAEDETLQLINDVRAKTRTGLPCGDARFVEIVEQSSGRSFSPKKRGPKPKI